jgi:hypothetical protein
MKKTITLWILVDKYNKIVYTGHNRKIVEDYKKSGPVFMDQKDRYKDCKVVKLTGNYNRQFAEGE